MSHVEHSLKNLLAAIERLDHAARYAETARKGTQRDMFAAPASVPPKSNPAPDAILAKRLDGAIRRVEELLSEGQ